MKDNDLSDAPTPRYWVTADVVFTAVETSETKKTGWFSSKQTDRVTYTPDLRTLSMLWRWSARMGVRLELIFFGNLAEDSAILWHSLDIAANPFSEYFAFSTVAGAHSVLPFRPDLLGIIDAPDRVLTWGGRGLTVENLR